MAHPDHDQVIGRLAGARLRASADRRAVSGAAEAHPDAETWAAYVDGGLQADEVRRLETHLAGCPACRRLVAVLAADVTSGAAPAAREVEAPAVERGVVIPFPRRQVFAWMAAAAGLLMAVTLWSVSRLGDRPPAGRVAMSSRAPEAAAPSAASPVPPSADAAAGAGAPSSRLEEARDVDRMTAQARAIAEPASARQEQDKRKVDAPSDALAMRRPAEPAAAEAKQAAPAAPAPAGNARNIQLQTNTVAAEARPRGPLASQQANQANQQASKQAGNPQQYAQASTPPGVAEVAPVAGAIAPAVPAPPPVSAPVPAPGAAPAAPAAQADAAAADTRERRTNEQLAESVTITSAAGARRASAPSKPERGQAAGAGREGQAQLKDEGAKAAAPGYTEVVSAAALPSFAEPGGRLLWRIADGRRLESSSDGGTTWTARYTARGDRLRAGTAPAIDSAWAVGERGRVLRLAIPGEWTEVSRPAAATLIAVSSTGRQAARVTADDGRVFETDDGGATWTQVPSGAGPP